MKKFKSRIKKINTQNYTNRMPNHKNSKQKGKI